MRIEAWNSWDDLTACPAQVQLDKLATKLDGRRMHGGLAGSSVCNQQTTARPADQPAVPDFNRRSAHGNRCGEERSRRTTPRYNSLLSQVTAALSASDGVEAPRSALAIVLSLEERAGSCLPALHFPCGPARPGNALWC